MHIIGGEITYECLGEIAPGTKRYRFTMKIYRDGLGGGAQFDNPANIAIYRGSYTANGLFQSFAVPLTKSEDLSAIIPECIDDIPPNRVQQADYVFVRDLPTLTDESYFIVYQRCCRNTTIRNLVNPGDQGATYFVELSPKAMEFCNNSPTFNQFPPIIICNNFPLVFDHSATDPEGDLLTYSFTSPLNGGGPILQSPGLFSCEGAQPTPPCAPPFDNVLFGVPTYSPANPMGGNPQIGINPTTGLITGIPNVLGQFVVGVRVQEYRNGVLLSEIRRDFQFNVADCTPEVFADIKEDSLVGIQKFVVRSCGSNTVTFQNQSVQQSNIDAFRWEFDLKGVPYVEASQWNPTITFPDTGTYFGKLYLNPGQQCNDTAEITVNIFPAINAHFEYDYDTCVAGPVIFTDKSYGDGGINRWQWDFGVPTGASTLQNPEYQYEYPGQHPVTLSVWDKNRCRDDSTAIIAWYPAPPVIIIDPDKFLGCSPADIFFNNLSKPIDSTYFIVWDYGDGQRDTGIISPTHRYTEPGFYDISIAITSPLGCFITDTFPRWIRISPSPTAAFMCDPDSALSQFNNVVQFIDQSTGAHRWNWQFGKYKTSVEQNPPPVTFPDTGQVKITLVVTHPQGCKDSTSKVLDFRPEIRWFMPNAFTPNGDGQNDGFLGKGVLEGATEFSMSIWNRWGEQVFETTDPNEAWNGRVMNTGGMSPAGVYVYLVTFTGPRGERQEYRGYATLVK